MRTFSLFIFMVMLLCGITFAQSESIKVGSTTRTFIVYTPSGLPEKPSLVVCMHGLGGSGSQQRSYSGFDKVADNGKFIVVYPDGTYKMNNSNGWDITTSADVEFITTLIDTLIRKYDIDPDRVYASGFSMGGMMSHKLACDVPGKIAAIGTASGYPLFGNDDCSPSIPVPICHTHGTADKIVPYTGLEAWISKFVKADGCPETPTVTNPTSKYKREYWGPCDEGSEIVVYHFDGMDHGYVDTKKYDFSASDTFWTFFKNHPRNNIVKTTNAVINSRITPGFTAVYSAGKIHLHAAPESGTFRSAGLHDVKGRTVRSWTSGSGPVHDLSFPADNLPAGIYFVKTTESTAAPCIKIIVP